MTFPRYLIADYERRNFSVSQCSWKSETQEDIVAIKPPANAEANGKSLAGSRPAGLTAGRIAGIVIGSTVGLLFIIFLAFVGKRIYKKHSGADRDGEAELAATEAPFLPKDETLKAKQPGDDGGSVGKHEMDSCNYPGTELGTGKNIQEMKSNDEVGHELATSDLQISELPG